MFKTTAEIIKNNVAMFIYNLGTSACSNIKSTQGYIWSLAFIIHEHTTNLTMTFYKVTFKGQGQTDQISSASLLHDPNKVNWNSTRVYITYTCYLTIFYKLTLVCSCIWRSKRSVYMGGYISKWGYNLSYNKRSVMDKLFVLYLRWHVLSICIFL